MRRQAIVLTTAAVLGLTGCAATAGSSAAGRTTATSSAASADAAAVAGSLSLPPPAPVAPPTTFSGPGGTSGITLYITKPAGTTTVLATITGGAPGYFFGVQALDGAKEVLAGARGVYQGSTLLDEAGSTTTALHVFSRGPWTITLSDPRSAPLFTGSFSGNGDTVGIYQGNGGTATVVGGASGTFFQIIAYGAGRLTGTLASGTDALNRQVHWPSGVALIKVRAVGPWSVTFG